MQFLMQSLKIKICCRLKLIVSLVINPGLLPRFSSMASQPCMQAVMYITNNIGSFQGHRECPYSTSPHLLTEQGYR